MSNEVEVRHHSLCIRINISNNPNTALAPIVTKNELSESGLIKIVKLAQTLHASSCRFGGQLENVKVGQSAAKKVLYRIERQIIT